ncbi:unnamed protein product [Rotaria sp. Silwood1]|nr:unnamed protein product [Rotaria sp. Silwood1]CAF3582726.1 unnamed protein product [Rotaria sp. Silwood1]CAF3604216.1 unnamed protein product [Rotaria sp. Silwood1]CAF3671782.1 unnamed protein product [Rotaria sp. Silwood1]CAF4711508.1 unnamed protein product [Rotaria sp. Silwood1]
MANIRIFVFLLVLLIIVNCALTQARDVNSFSHREKRLFACAAIGKRCSGVFGKSCCGGLVCHRTWGKCVRKGSATSWLGDRNGK